MSESDTDIKDWKSAVSVTCLSFSLVNDTKVEAERDTYKHIYTELAKAKEKGRNRETEPPSELHENFSA